MTPTEPTAAPTPPSHDPDGPVLVGVDGSEDGRRALSFARRAAQERGVDLLIAHAVDDAVLAGAWGVVYDPSLLQQAGESVIVQAVRAVTEAGFPADRVRTEIVMGNAAGALTRLSEQASLLIVGRRSVRGLERLFVGSTSVGAAGSAHCPVVMVSAATNVERTGGLHRIGVGVDSDASASVALRQAFTEARRRGAVLDIVHAWQPPTGLFAPQHDEAKLAELGRAAEAGVTALVDPFRQDFADVEVQLTVLKRPPVDELVARSADWDLLVIGVNAGPLGGVGAVVRGLMAHTRCPLALVRRR